MAESGPAQEVVGGDMLLERYFPRYYFDKDENFFPIDLNKYIADRSVVPGCNGVATRSKEGLIWLVYMNFYLEDGGVRVCGCAGCVTGDHAYDLEVVVVELGTDGAVSGVFYGPHSKFEHFWVRDPKDLEALLGGKGGDGYRPRVFVSLGKHASYPIEGTVRRLFGFGNDVCNEPMENMFPFSQLDKDAINAEFIDGTYKGPRGKITRDWSVAEDARVKSVSSRLTFPPWAQVSKELADLRGRLCCSCTYCTADDK